MLKPNDKKVGRNGTLCARNGQTTTRRIGIDDVPDDRTRLGSRLASGRPDGLDEAAGRLGQGKAHNSPPDLMRNAAGRDDCHHKSP